MIFLIQARTDQHVFSLIQLSLKHMHRPYAKRLRIFTRKSQLNVAFPSVPTGYTEKFIPYCRYLNDACRKRLQDAVRRKGNRARSTVANRPPDDAVAEQDPARTTTVA